MAKNSLINYNNFFDKPLKTMNEHRFLIDNLFNDDFEDMFNDKSWIVEDDHYELIYDNIPEKLDTLNVTVENGSIKIEYSYKDNNSSQKFSAHRTLPEDCVFDKIEANVEDNVLKINIPRKEE